jgi:hypothetical protein
LRFRSAYEVNRTIDLTHYPEANGDVTHAADAHVVTEAEREVVVAAGL